MRISPRKWRSWPTTSVRCAQDWIAIKPRACARVVSHSATAHAVEAVADLADLEALEEQLSQGDRVSTLDDVDVELLAKHLGSEAAWRHPSTP